jgi:hypothetical protein
MKRFLKWFLIAVAVLFVLTVVSLVALYFARDAILGKLVARAIKEQTGMVAEIGSFHVGLRDPVVSIKDFKLHNPAGFGDTSLLVIPEVFVEYDKAALQKNKLHLTQVRFNLGELNIVRNEAGLTNVLALGVSLPSPKQKVQKDAGMAELKKQTGMDFTGVDVITVSIGTARFLDLKNPQNNREQNLGIDKLILKNVKTPLELAAPLVVMLKLRSDDFFSEVFGSDVLGGLK